MTSIQVAVVWADIIRCEVGKILAVVIPAALIGALLGLAVVGKRRGRW